MTPSAAWVRCVLRIQRNVGRFTYDSLNRLGIAKDNRLAAGTTTYAYDNVGNLQGYLYPNGMQTAYSYNTLNRLSTSR